MVLSIIELEVDEMRTKTSIRFFNINLSKESPILYSLLIKSQEENEIILK